MILTLGIVSFASLSRAETSATKTHEGVVEQAMDGINYTPHVYNDHIGLQNVLVKPDKLVLRSSIDESSMVRWDIPNTRDGWSFVVNFNELNLGSSESAGLYLFYTNEKPVIGDFKGANSVFHGCVAGIEFNGKGVDLVYAKNDGLDYRSVDEYVTKVDSLNPRRFRNIEFLKLKVIATDKNFKVEIYDGDTIIYDNFRFFAKEDLENHKSSKYFGIFADYKNVSSGKAFEISSAQAFHREELGEYSVSRSYMSKTVPTVTNKNEISHPNTDVRDFIFKVNATTAHMRRLLGELPETILSHSEKELIKEMDALSEKLERLKSMHRNHITKSGVPSGLNELDLKIKKLSRSIGDIEYAIEDFSERASARYSLFEYITVFGGIGAMLVLLARELSEYWTGNVGRTINK